MNIIQFRNTRISQFNVADQEAASVCRLHIRCDLSKPVATAMGWGVLVGGSETELVPGLGKSVPLKGSVQAETVNLIPNGSNLKNRAIKFTGIEAKDFKLVSAGGGDDPEDDPVTTELRFTLTFAPEAAANVLKYKLDLKDTSALMKITVAKEQQMKLGEVADEGEEEKAPEEAEESSRGGSLASAREIKATVSER